jgi:nucleotide-binding universal stress UspA family protein
MFTRLLVPLDGTIEAAAALPAATTLARGTGARITLLRVLTDRGRDPADEALGDRFAEDGVSAAAAEVTRSGVLADWVVAAPPVASSIIQAAQTANADVIVMATHGRTGLGRAFAGSVSEHVVAGAGRPVLLLKSDGKHLDHIGTLLVPVDGTAGGVLGLSAAVGLARATGARLMLLQVVPPMPMWMYSTEASVGALAYLDPAWEEEALQSAQTYVAGLAERLRTAGLHVETRAVRGDVAPSIHAVADETDTDLVVMSTHALTGPARTVLGSVADAVVRTSHRPVLLVRRPGGTRDEHLDASRTPAGELAVSSVVG